MDIVYSVLIVAVIATICGAALSILSHVFSVPKDEREEKIAKALPGANCGSCGFSGCDGYAAAIAAGEAEPNLCAPGGAATAAALSEILGVEVESQQKVAFVGCRGSKGVCNSKFEHSGMESCAAAINLFGGPGSCPSSCLGFGDCVNVCPSDAIKICDSVAVIDPEKCTGCGKCSSICPKKLIHVVERKKTAHVICSNTEKGGVARKNCKAACIGCMKCAKICSKMAIRVENNLAIVNDALCDGCGECAASCPQKCIYVY